MKSIFVAYTGNYADTYANAVKISKAIPKSLFRGIVTAYEFNDDTKELEQNFEVRYAEPNEIETPLEITREFEKWLDKVYAKS